MGIGVSKKIGVREQQAGSMFLLSYRLKLCSIFSGIRCRIQGGRRRAQQSAKHGEEKETTKKIRGQVAGPQKKGRIRRIQWNGTG